MNVDFKTSMSARRLENTGFEQPVKGDVAKSNLSERVGLSGPSLTVTTAKASSIADFDEVTMADLRRDDDLGQLMGKVFDFQPPEMPNFV